MHCSTYLCSISSSELRRCCETCITYKLPVSNPRHAPYARLGLPSKMVSLPGRRKGPKMPAQKRNSNKTAAEKPTRACVAHMRENCPTCKLVRNGDLPAQPVPATREAWVSMAVTDTPTGRRWVQRTGDDVPGKSTRRTSPVTQFGKANVTARQMPGKPNNPSKTPVGHPTFVRVWSKKGKTFGITARGDLWSKDSSKGSKWARVRDFSNSGRTGITSRKPEPNEFFESHDTVLGRVIPNAGTVGTVGRSPFQTRV